MTPEEAEAYTRERWERVYGGGEIAVTVYAGEKVCHFLNYIAAAEFTTQREEEIRQKRKDRDRIKRLVEHEMKILNRHILCDHYASFVRDTVVDLCRDCRILAVLESQLSALLVGWKEMP